MTQLTGTWKTSTVSSSSRTLHATVLPLLRVVAEDTAGADAELMMPDEYRTSLGFIAAKEFPSNKMCNFQCVPTSAEN